MLMDPLTILQSLSTVRVCFYVSFGGRGMLCVDVVPMLTLFAPHTLCRHRVRRCYCNTFIVDRAMASLSVERRPAKRASD